MKASSEAARTSRVAAPSAAPAAAKPAPTEAEILVGEGGELDHPVQRRQGGDRVHRGAQRTQDLVSGREAEDVDRLAEQAERAAALDQAQVTGRDARHLTGDLQVG